MKAIQISKFANLHIGVLSLKRHLAEKGIRPASTKELAEFALTNDKIVGKVFAIADANDKTFGFPVSMLEGHTITILDPIRRNVKGVGEMLLSSSEFVLID